MVQKKNKQAVNLSRSLMSVFSIAVICSLMTAQACANIIGFDFGSSFFKITLVKAGAPFSIVENVTSQRKTHSQFTIGPENRLFSSDSFTAGSRYPKQTFIEVSNMLGMLYDEDTIDQLKKERFVMNDFTADSRGLVGWQLFNKDTEEEEIFYTEEILASILKYGRKLAEKQANAIVKDAVITIPGYYTQSQRLMMMSAAELAGMSVLQLVHENTAVATLFGIDRMDTEKDLNVLFYNMGGKDTEVSIVRYGAATDSSNKTHEHIEILGEGYDSNLGGTDFTNVIVNMLGERFNQLPEREGKSNVLENEKATKRIIKEATKAKDVLSANKETQVKLGELVDYVTLKTAVSREDFELRAEHLFERVLAPVEDALLAANLTIDQIDQVELVGGGIRVPKIQELLQAKLQTEELGVHMNGDEAMCFGSAFIASNSSSTFKVRKVYLTQHPKREIQIKITPLNELGDANIDVELNEQEDNQNDDKITYEKELVLYKKSDYLGQKKTIALTYDRAMKIDAYALNEDETSEHLATFELSDLDEISQNDIASKEDTTKPKVSLSFELSRSNIFKINKVNVSMEETKIEVQKVKKDKEESNDDEKSQEQEESTEEPEENADKQEQSEEETIEKEPETENETTEEQSAEKEAFEEVVDEIKKEEDEYETIEKSIKVPHTFPCDVNETYHGLPVLSADQMKEAKQRLKKLEQRDEDKLKTDEAKNEYEGLVYEVRGWLQEEENFPYVKEDHREDFVSRLFAAEDWLYEDGANAGYKTYQEKSYEIRKEYSSAKNRKEEHQVRDKVTSESMETCDHAIATMQDIQESKPWVTDQEKSDVIERAEETKQWVSDKIQEQSQLELHEDPIFTNMDVVNKMKKLAKLFKQVNEKKKPKEPKKKKEKKEKKEEEQAQSDDSQSQNSNEKEEAKDL